MEQERADDERRSGVLGLLGLMGVYLPEPATSAEMPIETLKKKLSTALTLCQALSDSDLDWFDFGMLRAWKGKTLLTDAFTPRANAAKGNAKRGSRGKSSNQVTSPAAEDTSDGLKQIIMHVARGYDEGHRRCVMQATGQKKICLRILDVHKYKDIPIVTLIYTDDEDYTAARTANSTNAPFDTDADDAYKIECAIEGQTLFHRLLELNSKRLPDELKTKLKYDEEGCNASFLVPVTSLKLDQITKLATTPRCELCGRLCSLCQTVSYCDQDAQRLHWQEHSSSCKGVQGGSWIDATFTENPIIDGEQKYTAIINHRSNKASRANGSLAPPSNVHGDKTFIVKIQRPLIMTGADDFLSMLVYDRNRTFTGHISSKENPGFWTAALEQMRAGSQKVKIYRNAKRSGDWTLSICLDREPAEVPKW
ncbi:hypothetical protein PENSPDRAFT_687544 [Peniophora sp. CONT]|nr:hypothetical protein PENSPDRAFT_687544 [Peniophora sp. CONT]